MYDVLIINKCKKKHDCVASLNNNGKKNESTEIHESQSKRKW